MAPVAAEFRDAMDRDAAILSEFSLNRNYNRMCVRDAKMSAKATMTTRAAAVEPQQPQQQITMTTNTIENHMLTTGKRTLFSALRSYQNITSGFYKFLARFSGRRRHTRHKNHAVVFKFIIILILSTLCNKTDACSSRTTPKPRPPTPTPRPNITFHTYKCPRDYADWYCLNEATCFTVKIADELLYNCECAAGYMGPRCEYKDLDGTYLPTRPNKMLETASIYSGALVAAVIVIVLVACYAFRDKKLLELEGEGNGMDIGDSTATGLDVVDGATRSFAMPLNASVRSQGYTNGNQYRCPPIMRPFGPHHHHTIPMSEALNPKKWIPAAEEWRTTESP